jgi:5-methylcytosine-specific restriction endonuclease McrA
MSGGRGQKNQNSETRRRARILAGVDGVVTCTYCADSKSSREMTIDHVVPISMGGERSAANVVACCHPCNQAKGNIDAKTFVRWLNSERGRTWKALGPTRGEPGRLWRERVACLPDTMRSVGAP